jgi:octaprenyl-diphosphate synthase
MLAEFLKEIEITLTEMLSADPASNVDTQILHQAANHLSLAKGAKRARPQLVYLFGRALDLKSGDLVNIGIAAELIHTASLLHDDVIDSGTSRRGRATVNALYGNKVAVLSGDFLLTMALKQLHSLPHAITKKALDVIKEMTIAAILELKIREKAEFSYESWRSIAEGKTGYLFGWCGQAPGLKAENSEAMDAFERCGRTLGIAFQMADDIRDFFGQDIGKNNFSDIINKNPNFIMILAANNSDKLKNQIENLWQKNEINKKELTELGKGLLKNKIHYEALDSLEKEIITGVEYLKDFQNKESIKQLFDWIEGLYKGYTSNIQIPVKSMWKKIRLLKTTRAAGR